MHTLACHQDWFEAKYRVPFLCHCEHVASVTATMQAGEADAFERSRLRARKQAMRVAFEGIPYWRQYRLQEAS